MSVEQEKAPSSLMPMPDNFDLGKTQLPKPVVGPRVDIVVNARTNDDDSKYRLPLPNDTDGTVDMCPNGKKETSERMQGDIVRAGRVLRGCRPVAHDDGDVTVDATRIRSGARRRVPGVSITLHE